jgi:hypothetical protein
LETELDEPDLFITVRDFQTRCKSGSEEPNYRPTGFRRT